MSERKYRQRGYDDDERNRQPKAPPRKAPEPGAPAGARRVGVSQDGPKALNMPGFRTVVRCAQCGNAHSGDAARDDRCPRCGADMHTCAQCASFDPGSRFECMQAISARISPKNARNDCTLFAPRSTVERETTTPRVDDPRKAFDDLFKF